jgi:ATP-dependent DNA helicase RecG
MGDQQTPRTMMEKAIKAMEESRPEPKNDGSAPLYVGVSVLFQNGDIDSASRGEFRYGDHAEYTLLERKHLTDKFDGALIFSTLEPCAGEHARSERKTPCASRLVEARVSEVWMGIQDPDPTIAGIGKATLEKADIQVHLFDDDLQLKINALNHDWIGQADRRAALAKTPDADLVIPVTNKMLMRVEGATLDDLDDVALERYRAANGWTYKSNRDPDFLVILTQTDWLTLSNRDKKTFHPTKMGMLLFGRRPVEKYHNCLVQGSYYPAPDEEPATKDFEGPLILFPEELEKWLGEVLPNVQMTHKVIRENFRDLVRPWIREATINAVVHRDYDVEGGKVSLEISQDVITVKSPAAIDDETLAQLNGLRAPSLSVNPKLHYAFRRMDGAEERGKGMKRLREVEAKGLFRPSYTYVKPFLTLTIPLTATAAFAAELLVLNPDTTSHLSPEEQTGLVYLLRNPRASNEEYGKAVGITAPASIVRQLRDLERESLIERSGPPRNRTITVTAKARR